MKTAILAPCIFFVALTSSLLAQPLVLGTDLSYVNELEDCGAVYYADGDTVDAFDYFGTRGCDLARFRLWHTPNWTTFCNDTNQYSQLNDVIRAIGRAKAAGMSVLLDFHYSDNWADPGKQYMPAAWRGITNQSVLQDSLYHYTYGVLSQLGQLGLFPEYVQIGNEINSGFVDPTPTTQGMNWPRTAALLGEAARAVRQAATDQQQSVQIVLHTAQPDHASWWYTTAQSNGITEYDIIGLSYYSKWSSLNLAAVGAKVAELKQQYNKAVWIVETAYPYSPNNYDQAGNIWNGTNDIAPGYPATPQGQRNFMIDLTQTVIDNGGSGVVYWEAAWISSTCCTQWSQGSSWENASFFDHSVSPIAPLPVFDFFTHPYQLNSAVEPGEFVSTWTLGPNPAQSWLQIETTVSLKEQVQIRLFSLEGKELLHTIVLPGQFPYQLAVGELPTGHYLISLMYQARSSTFRWVKTD